MTNYEKIKSMSIDEMASEVLTVELTGLCPLSLWQALPTKKTCLSKQMAIKDVLETEVEPTYCTDKQNKLVHCENCHEECKEGKRLC